PPIKFGGRGNERMKLNSSDLNILLWESPIPYDLNIFVVVKLCVFIRMVVANLLHN
ncbi:unnamed protein product, partial [marine sediment metagenome]